MHKDSHFHINSLPKAEIVVKTSNTSHTKLLQSRKIIHKFHTRVNSSVFKPKLHLKKKRGNQAAILWREQLACNILCSSDLPTFALLPALSTQNFCNAIPHPPFFVSLKKTRYIGAQFSLIILHNYLSITGNVAVGLIYAKGLFLVGSYVLRSQSQK